MSTTSPALSKARRLTGAALIAAFVSLDGKSIWLEGAMLLVLYVILAVAWATS